MSADDRAERDEALGAAVRQLQVPPPGPDFYPGLLARLRDEAATMEAERRPARWRRTTILSVAAAALVFVVAASWVGLPGTGSRSFLGPRPAVAVTAEELQLIVSTSVARAGTVTGEIAVLETGPPVPERRWSFAVTRSGDFRVTALDGRDDVSYNARTGTQRNYAALAPGRGIGAETTGLAAGPPDPAADPSVLRRSLGSAVRAFLAARTDAPVIETTHEGRAAWRLAASLSAPVPPNVDELEVVVDRETGFPLRIREAKGPNGANVRDVRISNLAVDAPVPPDRFTLEFPAGTPPVAPIDKGFRRMGLEAVAGAAGYQPLVPARLPEGFTLEEVAVGRQGDRTGEGRNPVSRDVVSLSYHRGFNRVTVSTRTTGGDPARWSDPLGTGPPVPVDRVAISAGTFAGTTADVVTGLDGVPHIWAVNDRLVVVVAGDLTRDELMIATGSL